MRLAPRRIGAIAVSLTLMAGLGFGVANRAGGDKGALLDDADFTEILVEAKGIAMRSGDEIQRKAFDDGVVSQDEYVLATNRMLDCLVQSGFTIDGIGRDWDGRVYSYGVVGPEDGEAAYGECYDRTARAVDYAYQMSVQNEKVFLLPAVSSCLIDLGIDKDDLLNADGIIKPAAEMIAVVGPSLWEKCVDSVKDRSPAHHLPSLTLEE